MSNKITVNNVLARILGEVEEPKLLNLPTDNMFEPIGNFGQVKKRIIDIHNASQDYRLPWKDVRILSSRDNIFLGNVSTGMTHTFSNHGLGQLCALLGVPVSYVKSCLEREDYEFAVENLNHWIPRMPQEKDIILRTTEHRIHGIVSTKYSVFDDNEVAEVVEGILGPLQSYYLSNYIVGPEYTKLRIISRDKIDIAGDSLQFGFDIKNSRVGKSRLQINILLYRYICQNGMVFGGGQGHFYTKRHIGISREDLITQFTEMLDRAPDIIGYLKKNVEASMVKKLNDDNIQNLINKFLADGNSRNAAGRIKDMMDAKYDRTLWGFGNAITELSQEYGVDTREKMEMFAGKIVVSQIA